MADVFLLHELYPGGYQSPGRMTTSQTRPSDTQSLTRLDRERESNDSVKNTVILYAIVIFLTNRLGGIVEIIVCLFFCLYSSAQVVRDCYASCRLLGYHFSFLFLIIFLASSVYKSLFLEVNNIRIQHYIYSTSINGDSIFSLLKFPHGIRAVFILI